MKSGRDVPPMPNFRFAGSPHGTLRDAPFRGVMRNAAGILFCANDRARFAALDFPTVMDTPLDRPCRRQVILFAGLMVIHAQKFRQVDYRSAFSSLQISIKVT
jgi:hypothetical protein